MIEREMENKKMENASKQIPSQSSTGDATPFRNHLEQYIGLNDVSSNPFDGSEQQLSSFGNINRVQNYILFSLALD
jgi:hypothetical protein